MKADLSYLKQHAWKLISLLFCKFQTISDKILGEFLKVCLKFPPPPIQYCERITWLDATFAHCVSTLLRARRG